jgi:hypothetical protein
MHVSRPLLLAAALALIGCNKDEPASARPDPGSSARDTRAAQAPSASATAAAPAASSLATNDTDSHGRAAPADSAAPVATAGDPAPTTQPTSSGPVATTRPTSTTAPLATATGTGSSPLAISMSAPRLKMLSTGAEPRATLRYHVTKGQKQTATVEVSMSPQGAPTQPMMSVVMTSTVTDVTPDNLIKADLTIDKFDLGAIATQLPPDKKGELDRMTKVLTQVKHHLVLTDHGLLKEDKLDAPQMSDPMSAQMIDSMKQVVSQVLPSLPDEAVGPGAKWEESHDITSTQVGLAMKLHSKATYELVSRTGDVAKLKVAMVGKSDPMLSVGGGPELQGVTMKGDGTSDLDFGKLLPVGSALKTTTSMSMKMNGQAISQNIDGQVKLTSH